MLSQASTDIRCLNEDNRRVWNVNAKAWDEAQGEQGNTFQQELVFPAAEQLLDIPATHYAQVSVSVSKLSMRQCPLAGDAKASLGKGRCWRSAVATAHSPGGWQSVEQLITCWPLTSARNSFSMPGTARPRLTIPQYSLQH